MDTPLTAEAIAAAKSAPDTLKVLMIGNSFSICVLKNLPDIVASIPGKRLLLASCYIGGCPLRRHLQNLVDGQKDPGLKPYEIDVALTGEGPNVARAPKRMGNILQEIPALPWDVVTIQQASHESWDYANYQPFAADLVAHVQKHAPQAEIVIQQTWAYRADDPRLRPGGEWGFDQAGMHARLREAYAKLAADTGFRVIPTGEAVRLTREREPRPFQPYPPESLEQLRWPDLPAQAGDVVGQCWWGKNAETGEMFVGRDSIHLNPRGEYLQGCVWFDALFGIPARGIPFISPLVGKNDALFLQRCAADAVRAQAGQ